MPSTPASIPEPTPRRQPWRLVALVLLILLGTPAALYFYHDRAADAALEEAIAAVDRPGRELADSSAEPYFP